MNENDKRIGYGAISENLDMPEDGYIEYRKLVLEISDLIAEGGYNPVSQLVGYLLSEDPTHIANYNNARNLISRLDRDTLLEDMVRYYLENVEENDHK